MLLTMEDSYRQLKRYNYKIVLLGNSSVGKSSLVLRFVKREYYDYQEPTIGACFLTKDILIDDKYIIKFEIWDTAGQERYNALAPLYYRLAAAAIVVYDVTDRVSFNKAKMWIHELKKHKDIGIIILVGNKIDLAEYRQIETREAMLYASDNDILFTEASAKIDNNVTEIFKTIATKLAKMESEKVSENNIMIQPNDINNNNTKSKCCSR